MKTKILFNTTFYRFFFTVFIVFFLAVSCSTTRYIPTTDSKVLFDAEELFYSQHPELVFQYENGFIEITNLVEKTDRDGHVSYKVKYVVYDRVYIKDYQTKMDILKRRFAEYYEMFKSGKIQDITIYKYIGDDNHIHFHLSSRYVYNSIIYPAYPYYNYYPIPYYRYSVPFRYHRRPYRFRF